MSIIHPRYRAALLREGEITAIRGQPGSGKSRLARRGAESILASGADVLWIDCDRTLGMTGTALSGVIVGRPSSVEVLTSWLQTLLGCEGLACIIIDALDALPSNNEGACAPHWAWTSEDELFAALRQHALAGVTIAYTEHARSFQFGSATSITRLSRRLSTDRRIITKYPSP